MLSLGKYLKFQEAQLKISVSAEDDFVMFFLFSFGTGMVIQRKEAA